MHLHFAFWIWQVFAQQQLALLKILVVDVLCPCLVVYKRILVFWWWWQWKRWQSTKQGTLAKQMPEWATDKQIVPPHTMIEEHCLQNAEDDTGRDVFCHPVHRMWTILSACCQYQYCRPPNPPKKLHPKIVDFICIFLSRRVFFAVLETWLLPLLCPMLWIHTTVML